MKNISFSILIGVIFFAVCTCNLEISEQSTLLDFADSLFQSNVDSSYIAGASVIVFQKGKELLDKSYGYASMELSAPMPDEACFEIGSVTKQFTAAAILRLVEEGKLSLEDDFTDYLEFDTKGRFITINNLLNHTSGIPSYTEIPEFWELSIHQYDRDTLVRLVEQKDFLFEPGEALIYNNSAYFFLGLIIEKITGKTYAEYLDEEFFKPLGMINTHYCSTSEVKSNKVNGYNYSETGLKHKEYLDHTWPYSAGSLCSSSEDLLVWMRALHEGKIFNEQLYKLLITPDQLKDGSKIRYAKGLVNYTNFGNAQIGHGGGINGFLSETRYLPDDDLYIICLVNTTGPRGAGFFARELTWKLLDKQTHNLAETDIDLESLAGKYSGQVRGRIHSIEIAALAGTITVSAVGQDKVDTLETYIGQHTWMDGNSIVVIENGEYRRDDVYGYFILKKQE
jgi:CubicO group peptidase (beta-lactamase class C family)